MAQWYKGHRRRRRRPRGQYRLHCDHWIAVVHTLRGCLREQRHRPLAQRARRASAQHGHPLFPAQCPLRRSRRRRCIDAPGVPSLGVSSNFSRGLDAFVKRRRSREIVVIHVDEFFQEWLQLYFNILDIIRASVHDARNEQPSYICYRGHYIGGRVDARLAMLLSTRRLRQCAGSGANTCCLPSRVYAQAGHRTGGSGRHGRTRFQPPHMDPLRLA